MRLTLESGGRDRDLIVRHVHFTEQDCAKMVGVLPRTPPDERLIDEGLKAHREA